MAQMRVWGLRRVRVPGRRKGGLMRLLFEGNNSLLYRPEAWDDRCPVPVVLKVLGPENPTFRQMARLTNEYELTRALDCRWVRRALERTTWQGRSALVLEYVDGQTLSDYFREGCDPLTLAQLAPEVTRGLVEAHRRGVVHKDINPNNILVLEGGRAVKLIDFGLAAWLDVQTTPEPLEGTLAYIAPEQTGRLNRGVDQRTDRAYFVLGLFCLGVFGSFPYYLPELFPARMRATGSGFCYNSGRLITAVGPFLVGEVARKGHEQTLHTLFWVFLVPGLALLALPLVVETRGRALSPV